MSTIAPTPWREIDPVKDHKLIPEDAEFCPADWLDEVVPTLAQHPNEFIRKLPDGRWAIVDLDADLSDPDWQDEAPFLTLTDGEIVKFCAFWDCQKFTVSVDPDGAWALLGNASELAALATHFQRDGDQFGEFSCDLNDIVTGENIGENPLPSGDHLVACWHWSDEIPYRFIVADGVGAFHPVEGAHANQ